MKAINTTAMIAILAAALTTSVSLAEAKSKTKRNAERVVNILPISKPAKALVRGNIRIYDRVGWEAGRLAIIKQYGPTADPGPYPGYNN